MIDKVKGLFGSIFGGSGSSDRLAKILELKQRVLNARSAEKGVYDELISRIRTKRGQLDTASAADRGFVESEIGRLLVRVKRQKSMIELLDRRLYELEEIEVGIRTGDAVSVTTVDAGLIDAINTDIQVAMEESAVSGSAVGDLAKVTDSALASTPLLPAVDVSEVDALLGGAGAHKPALSAEPRPVSAELQAELDALLGDAETARGKPRSAPGEQA